MKSIAVLATALQGVTATMQPKQRFGYALSFAIAGLLTFASVIYDMALPLAGVKPFVYCSLYFEVLVVYHLIRGLYEKQNKRKMQEAGSNR